MGKLKDFGNSLFLKLGAVLCAAAVIAAPVSHTAYGNSYTDDLQAQIDKEKADNEKRKEQIESLGKDIANNDEAIKLINEIIDGTDREITKLGQLIIAKQQDVSEMKEEIEETEREIADKEREIENKRSEIAEMQEENKANLERFAELARVMYMNDISGSIPILSGSDDWYEYFVYSDVIKNISGQNLNFMKRLLGSIKDQENAINELNSEIEDLEKDKQALQAEKDKLDKEMSELEEQRKALDKYASEQKQYLSELVKDNKELKEKVDSLEYDIEVSKKKQEALDKELEDYIKQMQQSGEGSQGDYSSDFRWPLDPEFHRLTTYFGWDNAFGGRNHGGIDIVGKGVSVSSRNIYAVQSGKVIKVYTGCPHDYGKNYSCGCGGGWGNYVVIDHGGGISTLYAHCRKIFVSVGQTVSKSDVIAIVGTTGWSQGEHLHFEVRENGVRVDPLKYTYHDVY